MKNGILKNFTKFTGKHQRQSLFSNSVGGLRLATLLKKRVWHSCFPMNLANFQEHRFYRKPLGDYFWLHFLFFLFALVYFQSSRNLKPTTAWTVSRYGVFPGPYFPAFSMNTEIYSISHISDNTIYSLQSECGKILTRKNSVFGHFSRSAHSSTSFVYFLKPIISHF